MELYISRAEHEEFVKRMEDEHKRMNHRLEDLENIAEDIHDMNTNISTLANNMKYIFEEQRKQGDRLDAFEKDKNSNWQSIKKGLFNAIGAAVGGAIIAAILFFA